MGFRTGAYAKVWEVTPMSDTSTKVRMSISRKNKQSGEYEQDFSGFVLAIGTAAAKKAASLKEGNRIKLGDVDVETDIGIGDGDIGTLPRLLAKLVHDGVFHFVGHKA